MRDHHGELFHYEVIARRPEPSFSVSLAGVNPTINRAGGKAFTITTNRLDGFNGPIALEITNMPAGFTFVLGTETWSTPLGLGLLVPKVKCAPARYVR